MRTLLKVERVARSGPGGSGEVAEGLVERVRGSCEEGRVIAGRTRPIRDRRGAGRSGAKFLESLHQETSQRAVGHTSVSRFGLRRGGRAEPTETSQGCLFLSLFPCFSSLLFLPFCSLEL